MIKKLTFGKDCRTFKAGFSVELRPGVNLLVGDQGCGKSTLLTALENRGLLRDADAVIDMDAGTVIKYFDFEKYNPRTASGFGGGQGGALSMDVELKALFASHGQAIVLMLADLGKNNSKPTTFLFDEPDMGLSIRSCRAVAKFFRILVAQGHQVIVAVHNPTIILSFLEVYSVEHQQWMKSDAFFQTQLEDPK